jgi:hypothetical protein
MDVAHQLETARQPDDPLRRPDRWSVQCRATSKQSGARCRNYSSPFSTTCRFHGSASPQARKAAARRMRALLPNAATVFTELMQPGVDDGVRLRAAEAVLAMNGIGKQPVGNAASNREDPRVEAAIKRIARR